MDLMFSPNLTLLLLALASALSPLAFSASPNPGNQVKSTCGFPGNPKNGRVLHLLEKYEEGMVVTFECNPEYYLLGSMTRTCLSNGTWSGSMPVCDQSVKILGLTSASEALLNYPPQLAVDGNFRTCFFSNRRKPRWWRVELPKQSLQNQSIISVALTLPPIHADLHFSIYVIETVAANGNSSETPDDQAALSSSASSTSKYHKCASFRGVFSSKTIVIQCANQFKGGLKGNYLQIEDDYPQLEYFGLCEVDIFVERETYQCGSAEVPSNGYVLDKSNQSKEVEYFCHDGYRLVGGESIRTCNLKTGQWSGSEPFCERITCPAPSPLANGFYRVFADYQDVPVVGTRAVYECAPGFLLVGVNDTRQCDSTGEWLGAKPHCEAIDCNHPESLLVNADDFMLSGAHFRLLNGTTKYSAIAELVCPSHEVLRNNLTRPSLLFSCREDGIWTEVIAPSSNDTTANEKGRNIKASSCVRQRHNGLLYYYGTAHKGSRLRKSFYLRDNSINMLHFLAAVVITAFICILIIVVLLFKRRIIELPENSCSPFNDRVKLFGQSVKQGVSNLFGQINGSIQSFISQQFGQRTNAEPQKEPERTFTITPSVSDIESARGRDEHSTDLEEVKEFESNFTSFYDEIKSAARQVFAEDTDRKLMRAARIAAELDIIKTQHESAYHWIYASPPRQGSSSLPPSLTPSVHESSQIPSSSQIYAKVDLIRKHRFRKENQKETSVYQIPRPRHMEIDPNSSLISQSSGGTVYQLRKAISSPEAVFVEGEYATIRRLRLEALPVASGTVAIDQTPIQAQQINPIPIQTLL